MSGAFTLAPDLRRQLENEARAAFPRECCGLIEGRFHSHEAVALHAVKNIAVEKDRFELDPVEQFRLLKAVRARDTAIIGCYHSHPNGKPEPSAADLAGAGEDNFLWLILALSEAKGAVILAPYVFRDGGFSPLEG